MDGHGEWGQGAEDGRISGLMTKCVGTGGRRQRSGFGRGQKKVSLVWDMLSLRFL